MDKVVILSHPKLGDKPFSPEHAKKLMSIENNGGWEYKKQPPRIEDAESGSDKGKSGKTKEEGRNL